MGKEVKKIREITPRVKVVREINKDKTPGSKVSESQFHEEEIFVRTDARPSPTMQPLPPRVPEARIEDDVAPVRVREERQQGNTVDYMAIGNRTATTAAAGATSEPRVYKPAENIQTDRIRANAVRDFGIQTQPSVLPEQTSVGQIERRLRDEEEVAREKYHVDSGMKKGKRYAWDV